MVVFGFNMPCYHPLAAWVSSDLTDNGKYGIVFRPSSGVNENRKVEVPCGTCIGCRLDYAYNWSVRCVHESKLWDENHFVTLTYTDMPVGGSLVPGHVELFMKRLRESQERVFGVKPVRFLLSGEYGTRLERPHYHALLFNVHIPDRVLISRKDSGDNLYGSKYLSELWGYGFVSLGNVTAASAGYVARYAVAKAVKSDSWYGGRCKEFLRMSRRPGIGRGWAEKFLTEWMRSDSVIVDGRERKPPRYYDDLCQKLYPDVYAEVKRKRVQAAVASPDNAGRRLIARECVKASAVSILTRPLED